MSSVVRDVLADLDVAEEAKPRSLGDPLERARDGLQVRMVGRDAEADEPPRRRQPLDHVHLGRRIGAREQVPGGVEGRRPGSDHGDAERHACAVVAHGSPSYCRAQGSSRHADRARGRPRRGGARLGRAHVVGQPSPRHVQRDGSRTGRLRRRQRGLSRPTRRRPAGHERREPARPARRRARRQLHAHGAARDDRARLGPAGRRADLRRALAGTGAARAPGRPRRGDAGERRHRRRA